MTKEKNNKPSKELPLGFVDRQEKELLVRDFIISNIKEVMIKYGFQYLETPSFEYSDSIGKFLPDKDRPDSGVFSFKDENKWLSLRYDLTAPLARYVAKNYLELAKPFKRYQLGTVWRNEKPGPGRFREFLQFDADFVGTKSLQADAELCVMISEILEKCGLTKSDYIIKISSRKITEELFKKINLNDGQQKLTALRALDKIDRLGWNGVKELLAAGRKDKSGDFTKGANLKSKDIETIEETLRKKLIVTEDLVEILKIFKDYKFSVKDLPEFTSFQIKVVFNEPVAHVGAVAPRLKLVLANTVSGQNSLTANALAVNSNTGIEGANNTLVFTCKPASNANRAGTYKIGAQTIVKLGSGTANLASLNSNRITANLVINAAVSNSLASFTIEHTS